MADGDTSVGGTPTEEGCPLGGDTVQFDAAGTPFVFTFQYDGGYTEPEIREGNAEIWLEVEGGYGTRSASIRQGDPSITKNEPTIDEILDKRGWEVATEFSFGGETVRVIEDPESRDLLMARLPHEKRGENGVEVQLGASESSTGRCPSEELRQNRIRLLESFGPNPDSTL